MRLVAYFEDIFSIHISKTVMCGLQIVDCLSHIAIGCKYECFQTFIAVFDLWNARIILAKIARSWRCLVYLHFLFCRFPKDVTELEHPLVSYTAARRIETGWVLWFLWIGCMQARNVLCLNRSPLCVEELVVHLPSYYSYLLWESIYSTSHTNGCTCQLHPK